MPTRAPGRHRRPSLEFRFLYQIANLRQHRRPVSTWLHSQNRLGLLSEGLECLAVTSRGKPELPVPVPIAKLRHNADGRADGRICQQEAPSSPWLGWRLSALSPCILSYVTLKEQRRRRHVSAAAACHSRGRVWGSSLGRKIVVGVHCQHWRSLRQAGLDAVIAALCNLCIKLVRKLGTAGLNGGVVHVVRRARRECAGVWPCPRLTQASAARWRRAKKPWRRF